MERLSLFVYLLGGVIVILSIFNVWLYLKINEILRKNKKLFGEVKSGDVIQILNSALKELDAINSQINKLEQNLNQTDALAKKSFHKFGLKRFNPFNDTGGDQSFSLSMLDDKDNGFVLTSIHGREGNRVYAKPVEGADSDYNLADEEKDVIKIATKPKTQKG
jgi:hypothetical protein